MVMRKSAPSPKGKAARKPDLSTLPDWFFWEGVMALGRSIPREEWEKLPRDLAKNFDHYLDGSPRQD